MLVTMAILAVLAAAVLPLAKIAVQREKEFSLRRNLRILRDAIDSYKKLADEKKFEFEEETNGYPPDLDTLVQGVEVNIKEGDKETIKIIKFLRRIPKDPMINSYEWGLRSYQDKPDSVSWGGQNVYDVYTKNPGTALDGSKYNEW
jgi:general secretion pathway protein G